MIPVSTYALLGLLGGGEISQAFLNGFSGIKFSLREAFG